MKYIDAEKLIVEIEMWRDKAKEKYNESVYHMGRCDALAEFRNHIVSLLEEQPEVDFEKFISDFIDKKDSENQGKWCEEDIIEAMKSSFALGFNARKEDK